MTRPNIVSRSQIRSISQVEIEGAIFDLGDHRDFRRHDLLRAFMPESGRVSISWTRLGPGGRLQDHTHPTASMIVMCRGQASLTGDVESPLAEGDIVTIPAGCRHGFIAQSDDGFEALSIQFDGEGLYENEPRVQPSSRLDQLMEANNRRLEKHVETAFYRMIDDELVASSPKWAKFERALKFWSAQFQRVLHARATFSSDPRFKTVFRTHLREELDHDLLLGGDEQDSWDPVLATCSEWFVSQMYSSSDLERLAIVHLVLEASGHEFYERIVRLDGLKDSVNAGYYVSHHHLDEGHATCGQHLLNNLSSDEADRLQTTLTRAWDVLETLFDRIVTIVEAV